MTVEVGTIRAFVQYTDGTGSQYSVGYSFATDDHVEAARQAFKWCGDGSGVRVRMIETFAEEPHRWNPAWSVEEIV